MYILSLTGKIKASELKSQLKTDLLKKLEDLKQELSTVRINCNLT